MGEVQDTASHFDASKSWFKLFSKGFAVFKLLSQRTKEGLGFVLFQAMTIFCCRVEAVRPAGSVVEAMNLRRVLVLLAAVFSGVLQGCRDESTPTTTADDHDDHDHHDHDGHSHDNHSDDDHDDHDNHSDDDNHTL